MAQRVVGIAAGEAHTLALTGDGNVFSWGRGTFGRLGTGKEEDELFPVPVGFDLSKRGGSSAEDRGKGRPKFVGIAAGAYHGLALEDNGSVWSWGYNIYGQLGQGEDNSSVPCLVERFLELGSTDSLTEETNANHEKTPLKVSSIKAGGMMSLAIDILGALWIWGNCPQQSNVDDGEFCLMSSPAPLPVWDFHGRTVVKVACGNEHVLALVTAGETFTGGDLICYSWGNNNHGQLGLGDNESRSRPQILSTFNTEAPWAIYEIACGAFHTAVLTQSQSSDEEIGCKCWTFGLGENGQLGLGTTDSYCLPEPVDGLPPDAVLISIECGLFHTSVVSAAGDVWSWGMERGLGLCPDVRFSGNNSGDALSPVRIKSAEVNEPKFVGPVQIACGAAHTVLVAAEGYKLWAWGRGRSGVLGSGHLDDSFAPSAVMWPPVEGVNAGAPRTDGRRPKLRVDRSRQAVELDQNLSPAAEEVQLLRTKLRSMERYASVLHAAVFGSILEERNLPQSLQDSNYFDIKKELENVIESADQEGLALMESFYRKMLARIKDKLMKRRVQEIVRECFSSLSMRTQPPSQ